MVRWLTISISLLALFCASAPAQSPTMTITWSLITEEDVDGDRPGYQFLITYNVRNSSPVGDINNMIKFTLPAGTSQSIYRLAQGGSFSAWSAAVNQDAVVLDGTGHAMAPTHYATAEAWGGTGGHIPFRPVLVEVPTAEEPPRPGLGSVRVASNQVSLGLTNLWTNYHYTVEQSVDLAGWTAADGFCSPGASTNWSAPAPTNAPAQFYRLRSP